MCWSLAIGMCCCLDLKRWLLRFYEENGSLSSWLVWVASLASKLFLVRGAGLYRLWCGLLLLPSELERCISGGSMVVMGLFSLGLCLSVGVWLDFFDFLDMIGLEVVMTGGFYWMRLGSSDCGSWCCRRAFLASSLLSDLSSVRVRCSTFGLQGVMFFVVLQWGGVVLFHDV